MTTSGFTILRYHGRTKHRLDNSTQNQSGNLHVKFWLIFDHVVGNKCQNSCILLAQKMHSPKQGKLRASSTHPNVQFTRKYERASGIFTPLVLYHQKNLDIRVYNISCVIYLHVYTALLGMLASKAADSIVSDTT